MSARRAAVLGALALGLALRLYGLSFGLPYNTQPDEVFLDYFVLQTVAHRFLYYYPFYDNLQTLVLALCHGAVYAWLRLSGTVGDPIGYLTAHLRDPSVLVLTGRALSAVESTAGLVAAGLVAARLAGPSAFPVAALFAAVAANSVQDGHYMKGHCLTATLMTFALAAVLSVRERGDRRSLAVAGALIGLACASKIYAGVLALPLALAVWRGPCRSVRDVAGGALAGAAVYLAVSPGLLLHPLATFERAAMLGDELGRSFIDTGGEPLWLHYWTTCLPWSLGLPLLALGVAGLARAVVRRHPAAPLVVAYVVAYTVALQASAGFYRYAIPLELVLCASAASAVVSLTERLPERFRALAAGAVVLAVAALPAARAVAFDRYVSAPDTRAEAAAWLSAHLPAGATVAVEGIEGPFLTSLVGPQLPPARERLDREQSAARGQAMGRLLEALREAGTGRPHEYRVINVSRLDEEPRSGADFSDVHVYLVGGVDWLVSSGWVPRRRVPEGRYAPRFQADLDAHYEVVEQFAPSPELRWDAIGWLVDYERLPGALAGGPLRQGPRVLVYRRRAQPARCPEGK